MSILLDGDGEFRCAACGFIAHGSERHNHACDSDRVRRRDATLKSERSYEGDSRSEADRLNEGFRLLGVD